MPKRITSKISSYIKPQQQQVPRKGENSQACENAVIADDISKGLQTQAKQDKTFQNSNSQEVIDLLNKINTRLEHLQEALNESRQAGSQDVRQNQPETGHTQDVLQSQSPQQVTNSQAEVSSELRQLFSMLFTNNDQQTNLADSRQSQAVRQGSQSQDQHQNQANYQNNNINQNKPIAVQTAAQVLAQAQYELSNELEASLKKLKQVISESEKIANKISNLLGEENSRQQ